MERENSFSVNWFVLFAIVWAASGLFIVYLLLHMTSPHYAFHALYCDDVLLTLVAHAVLSICLVVWFVSKKATRKSLSSLFLLTAIVAVPLALNLSFFRNSPLQFAFWCSQSGLTEVAASGKAGDQCGWFVATQIEKGASHTIIFTNGNSESSAPCGFVTNTSTMRERVNKSTTRF